MSMAGVNTEEVRLNPNDRTEVKYILWLYEIIGDICKPTEEKGCKYQWACSHYVSPVLWLMVWLHIPDPEVACAHEMRLQDASPQ